MTIPYAYDAGVLLAIDRNDRWMWAIHHLAVEEGRRLLVPAIVVAQGWRDARRQVQLGRFLNSCEVTPVGLEVAKAAGVLCGKAGTRDVVDATVVTVALSYGAIVFTSDPDDIARLGAAADAKPGLIVRRVSQAPATPPRPSSPPPRPPSLQASRPPSGRRLAGQAHFPRLRSLRRLDEDGGIRQ